MTPIPPTGSKITVRTDDGDPVIVIPYATSGLARYSGGLFLLVWFALWTAGLVAVGTKFIVDAFRGHADIFTAFWLVIAIMADVYAGYAVFRIFRPAIPETFRLKRGSLLYDSGVIPPQMTYGYTKYRNRWNPMFAKRTVVEIDRKGLQTLRLRDTDSGNRLTVDANAARLDLAVNSTEIEREWLYQLIADRYTLDNAQIARS
jgi:hypothetical protein